MIVRIWTTGVDPARRDELADFARTQTLPTFRRHHGLLGVLFAGSDDTWVTLSAWRDATAVAALEASPDYRALVQRILAAGFLTGQQRTDAYEVVDGDLGELARALTAETAPG
jgi:quinol monooxygenase YgiN